MIRIDFANADEDKQEHQLLDSLRDLPMAEANGPKKETVRIKLPPRQAGTTSNTGSGSQDTVRINLPPRALNNFGGSSPTLKPPSPPSAAAVRTPTLLSFDQPLKAPSLPEPSVAEPVSSPLHSPSSPEPIVEPNVPAPRSAPAAPKVPVSPSAPPPAPALTPLPGPKKDTARIATIPEPKAAAPTVKMSKTQPLITAPNPLRKTTPMFIEPTRANEVIESIPIPLCWALVGLSALLFIIQLWTYFS